MDENLTSIINLVSCALHKEKAKPGSVTDWYDLIALAKVNGISTFLFPVVEHLNEAGPVLPDALLSRWKNEVLVLSLTQLQQIESFRGFLPVLLENNIRFILYKGIVIKEAYPYPELRMMSDIDMLVPEEDFDECIALFEASGYIVAETDHRVVTLAKLNHKVIEVHKYITDPEIEADISFIDELAWTTQVDADFNGLQVKTLSPDVHLAFLIFHMYKHYAASGANISQVCDIILFTKKYAQTINWDSFRDIIMRAGKTEFTAIIFSICREYLKVSDIDHLIPDQVDVSQEDMETFIAELLRKPATGISEKTVENEFLQQVNSKKSLNKTLLFKSLTSILFPGPRNLDDYYDYAKKIHILLPIAWIHRIFRSKKNISKYLRCFFQLAFSSKRKTYLKKIGMIR